jgi:DNA repair exonuclease SbcCD nuclease subunit
MSIIITSDIQAEFNNLDLCQQAWNEILSICKEQDIKTIADLGDSKQAYNPVDIRVIRWWQDAIRRAVKKGIKVLKLLGNHDRVGQYTDADNWLPILRRAGAQTFDTPKVIFSDWGGRIFLLPFSKADEAKRNIKRLLKSKPDRQKDVLLFHHDLKKALYNQQGSVSDASLTGMDISCNAFNYCIGGHLHQPQTLEKSNIYYVGSPFCHDWGEVNQRKRYLIVDKTGITSITSAIPGWYDPFVSNFRESRPSTWRGTRVRINVPCDASTDYGRRLENARRKAERKYKGADIFVVPKFKERESISARIKASDTDERKLREYIRQTNLAKSGLKSKGTVLDYMLEKLSHFSGGLRTGSKIKFLYAKGTNFLPFKKVKTDFTVKGITVIQGINKDRTDKSNGSGKTSLVQLLPVAMFGKTYKDQSHDAWSTRNSTGIAKVEVALRDYKGRTITIERGRRPPLLRMLVEGADVSSGMKSNDKDGTQAQIEQTTGFTWQTLANAVYIDRTIADAFLSGTNKQRTDVLSRFQNLERFTRALELVKKDERKNRESLLEAGEQISNVRGAIKECEESVNSLKELSKVQLDGAYKEYSKRKTELKDWNKEKLSSLKKLESKANKTKIIYQVTVKLLVLEEKQQAVIESELEKLEHEGVKLFRLKKKRKCPMCYQKVSGKWITKKSEQADSKYVYKKQELSKIQDKVTVLRRETQLLDGKYTKTQQYIGKLDNEKRLLEASKKTAQRQCMELNSDTAGAKHVVNKTENKLKQLVKEKKSIKHKMKKYNRLNVLYEYAIEAFSRDGIPAFLNRQLCPILNKAASYYAELFSDNEIQLQFKVEKGEFVPEIINVKGGANIDDQSEGERSLAGLIASFALREVAPRCNLLILDEPGNGLDSQTAKQFARALQHLVKRFKAIWVVTHNQHILSELSGERTLTVVKQNGISKLKEN